MVDGAAEIVVVAVGSDFVAAVPISLTKLGSLSAIQPSTKNVAFILCGNFEFLIFSFELIGWDAGKLGSWEAAFCLRRFEARMLGGWKLLPASLLQASLCLLSLLGLLSC